jgi:hypothetical protein|nr:MAG TPA: hypothetical protein [Caudoviricetes sp.]
MSIFSRKDLENTRERGTNPPAKGPRPSHPGRESVFKKESINPGWGKARISLEDNGNLGGQLLNIEVEKPGLKAIIKVEHNTNEALGILKLYNLEFKDDDEFNTSLKIMDFFTGDSEFDKERIVNKIKTILEQLYTEGINYTQTDSKKINDYVTLVTKVFTYLRNRDKLQKKYPAANTFKVYSTERGEF